MTFTVDGYVLLWLALGLLALAIGIYLLVVLKNANRLITNINKTVVNNQEQLDQLLHHLGKVSGNTAQLSDSLMKQYRDNELLVNTMIRTGAESAVLINDTTSKVKSLVQSFNDIVYSVNRLIKKWS
jgi:uncharacterized membrane-anchored protein YhcB (DUF1043 family)